MYWWHADLYMIDRNVAAITPLQAVALSAALLVAGWIVLRPAVQAARASRTSACWPSR